MESAATGTAISASKTGSRICIKYAAHQLDVKEIDGLLAALDMAFDAFGSIFGVPTDAVELLSSSFDMSENLDTIVDKMIEEAIDKGEDEIVEKLKESKPTVKKFKGLKKLKTGTSFLRWVKSDKNPEECPPSSVIFAPFKPYYHLKVRQVKKFKTPLGMVSHIWHSISHYGLFVYLADSDRDNELFLRMDWFEPQVVRIEVIDEETFEEGPSNSVSFKEIDCNNRGKKTLEELLEHSSPEYDNCQYFANDIGEFLNTSDKGCVLI